MNQNEKDIINSLPSQFRPLSPWAYFGYSILFSIPFVGFILLIVFSFVNDNINRRNFARSFFCIYAIIFILIIVLAALGVSTASLLNY